MANSRSSSGGVTYLNERDVQDVRQSKPPLNRSRTGYGGKIGTSHELKIAGRWYRVYVMIYSNSGSPYVVVKGKNLFLGSFEPRDFHEEWYQKRYR